MSTNALPDPLDDDATHTIPAGALEILPPAAGRLAPPPGIAPEEAAAYQEQARTIAAELSEARGSREMELTDSVSNLGVQAQRQAGAELGLLRRRVGEMMAQKGTGSETGYEYGRSPERRRHPIGGAQHRHAGADDC
jgi:hypothetical protein